jgi:hypothetical protein
LLISFGETATVMNEREKEKHRLAFRETFAKTGHETLKALLIVSGGAAAAYLAFLGSTFSKEGRFEAFGSQAAVTLVLAMRDYILGVASALLCYIFTWFSHGSYYFALDRTGHVIMVIAVFFGFACIGLFVVGSLHAAWAFEQAAQRLIP